ncbi:MAG: glycosyltransferase [Pseudodesulfovibrio sp.]
MRILQLAKYYPPAPGGIETFVRDLSHGLVAQGHGNMVLAHRFHRTEPKELTGSMGRVVRVPSHGEVMYSPVAPTYLLHLRRALRTFRPDAVLVHMPNVSGFWPLLLRLPCPLIAYWHSDVIFPAQKRLHRAAYTAYALFERALLSRAAEIIATSPPYLEHSLPLRPFRDKCTVIPLAIDPGRMPACSAADVAAAKERFLGDADAEYIYAAGRFAHYKGFEHLIRAARLAKGRLPELRYVIAGEGETRRDILRLIEREGLCGLVRCPGHVDNADYWALMAGCKAFCLPSVERTEAFGIVLLEAMALGKPCISTSIPGSGTAWINRHGETGIVVEPGNAEALAEAFAAVEPPATDTEGGSFQQVPDLNDCVRLVAEAVARAKKRVPGHLPDR